MLPLARTGVPEESFFTFTYSPIRDESSGVGGVFCAVVETTDKVIEGRRLRLLNALAQGGRLGLPRKRAHTPQWRSRKHRPTSPSRSSILWTRGRQIRSRAPRTSVLATHGRQQRSVRAMADPGVQAHVGDSQAFRCRRASRRARRSAASDRAGRRWPSIRVPGCRAESDAAPEPSYTRFHTLLGRQHFPGRLERRGVPGRAQARRGARRARSRQDRLLQQRQPRVPHAADADARPDRGPARRAA